MIQPTPQPDYYGMASIRIQDLEERVNELETFILKLDHIMHTYYPHIWMDTPLGQAIREHMAKLGIRGIGETIWNETPQ